MKHILELTALYKMGHQRLSAPIGIIGRNICRIEKVPEELPDFSDGCNTRVQLAHGESLYVAQPYEEVLASWHEALEHSL